MYEDFAKDLLISEMQLTSIAVKLNRAKEGSENDGPDAQRLDDCIRQVVEAANLLDELLESTGQ